MRRTPLQIMTDDMVEASFDVDTLPDEQATILKAWRWRNPSDYVRIVAIYDAEDKFNGAFIWGDDIELRRINATHLRKFVRGEWYPHTPSVVPVAFRGHIAAIAEEKIKQ